MVEALPCHSLYASGYPGPVIVNIIKHSAIPVNVPVGVVEGVWVPIEQLRVQVIRRLNVCASEPAGLGIIIPVPVIVQSRWRIQLFPSILEILRPRRGVRVSVR